jgi:hypothetical protein
VNILLTHVIKPLQSQSLTFAHFSRPASSLRPTRLVSSGSGFLLRGSTIFPEGYYPLGGLPGCSTATPKCSLPPYTRDSGPRRAGRRALARWETYGFLVRFASWTL